ncbi:MAG TPA: hypothetical protein DD668_08875 [Alphaproteobacteria bacterium]|nr:hypothetical protein [Alphaproteobacteria bacterium]
MFVSSLNRVISRRAPRLSSFTVSVWSLLLAACGGGGGGGPVASGPVASGPVASDPEQPLPATQEPAEDNGTPQTEEQQNNPTGVNLRRLDPAPLLYLENQAFRFDQATQMAPLRVSIFEQHPTDKSFVFLPSLKSLMLPFGIADNNLFRLEGGKLVFRAPPDFEAPTDTGNGGQQAADSEYHIRLVGLDQDSRPVILPVIVRVLDLPNEKTGRYNSGSDYGFKRRSDVSEMPAMPENNPEELPSVEGLLRQYPLAEVAKIIWGPYWSMPATGPLVLTWSLKVRGILAGVAVADEDVQKMRKLVELALLKYEQVVDIQFVEVDEFNGQTGHIDFLVQTNRIRHVLHTETLGRANAPGREVHVDIYDSDGLSTIIHEIGHALGLKHPFSSGLKKTIHRWQNKLAL